MAPGVSVSGRISSAIWGDGVQLVSIEGAGDPVGQTSVDAAAQVPELLWRDRGEHWHHDHSAEEAEDFPAVHGFSKYYRASALAIRARVPRFLAGRSWPECRRKNASVFWLNSSTFS